MKAVTREVKKRVESADLYRKNDRAELAEPEEKEAEILRNFASSLARRKSHEDCRRSYCRLDDVSIQKMGSVKR